MPWGGNRPGAGRPRRAVKHARPIAQAEKRIADRLPLIIDRMFELADGVLVQEDGGRVYARPPDRDACRYLIDRILGRPRERSEADVNIRGAAAAIREVIVELPPAGNDEPVEG